MWAVGGWRAEVGEEQRSGGEAAVSIFFKENEPGDSHGVLKVPGAPRQFAPAAGTFKVTPPLPLLTDGS